MIEESFFTRLIFQKEEKKKEEKKKGEKMEELINLIISGHYSDWFFDTFLTQFTIAIKNNLAFLLLFAMVFKKLSKLTTNNLDDKIIDWIIVKLIGFKNPTKEGEKHELEK